MDMFNSFTLLEFLLQGGSEMVLSEVFDLFVKQSPVTPLRTSLIKVRCFNVFVG